MRKRKNNKKIQRKLPQQIK